MTNCEILFLASKNHFLLLLRFSWSAYTSCCGLGQIMCQMFEKFRCHTSFRAINSSLQSWRSWEQWYLHKLLSWLLWVNFISPSIIVWRHCSYNLGDSIMYLKQQNHPLVLESWFHHLPVEWMLVYFPNLNFLSYKMGSTNIQFKREFALQICLCRTPGIHPAFSDSSIKV